MVRVTYEFEDGSKATIERDPNGTWYLNNTPTRTEYGYRFDCVKQGCERPHENADLVYQTTANVVHSWTKVNGHAITWVKRLVIYNDWLEVK